MRLNRQTERCTCGKFALLDVNPDGVIVYCSGYPKCQITGTPCGGKRAARASWNAAIRAEKNKSAQAVV